MWRLHADRRGDVMLAQAVEDDRNTVAQAGSPFLQTTVPQHTFFCLSGPFAQLGFGTLHTASEQSLPLPGPQPSNLWPRKLPLQESAWQVPAQDQWAYGFWLQDNHNSITWLYMFGL